MKRSILKNSILSAILCVGTLQMVAQKTLPFRLPDSGQTGSYTTTPGEDADYLVNAVSLTDNGDGTVTDNITGLEWQKTDGGEMTWENAGSYCENLLLGGFSDWRLPTGIELLSINNFNHLNPALDNNYFTTTTAEYWWTCEVRADDPTKVWAVNSGGGIGAHPKTETVSAGGVKQFHVRAVRTPFLTSFSVTHFTDNGNGTVSDNFTGLIWQKSEAPASMTWEQALEYAATSSLAGKTDWRLPDIKELQSLNDPTLLNPSFNENYFTVTPSGDYWSSTTLFQTPAKAWDINIGYGIVTQHDKTLSEHVLLVRGGYDNPYLGIAEVPVPGGEYQMGDHFGFVSPGHPSDEIPIHLVRVDSFNIGKTEITNRQFIEYLNASLVAGTVQVNNNKVHFTGDTAVICYTHQYESWYSISYDGSAFSIAGFRNEHPVVGVMWAGAAAFCNWLSLQNALGECYDPQTWACDFTKTGYRLPTEAEWEYAGRGGHTNPYFNYQNGNTIDIRAANLPSSGDPYETGAYPLTTPAGFYDGSLKLKTDYNWPGSAGSYQTDDGANGFGIYDMQGNVWEFINDWYETNYYSLSPYDNPTGPATGSIMPDGKPYRGMRGGNWYNGLDSNGVNDGHSRISNRDPSYYRGPLDPNNPWYHVGFRIARQYQAILGSDDGTLGMKGKDQLFQNSPNPFRQQTTMTFSLTDPSDVTIVIHDILGREVARLYEKACGSGFHALQWDSGSVGSGIYFATLLAGMDRKTLKMIIQK